MRKRTEKTVVPSREERLKKIGDPKTPRMGGLSPKTIAVPEVGDLLGKMAEAAPVKEAFVPFNFEYVGVTFTPRIQGSNCNADCKCPPCLRGDCGDCLVDAQRGMDINTIRDAVFKWRGVKLP